MNHYKITATFPLKNMIEVVCLDTKEVFYLKPNGNNGIGDLKNGDRISFPNTFTIQTQRAFAIERN